MRALKAGAVVATLLIAGCGGGGTTTVFQEAPAETVERTTTVEVPAERPEKVERQKPKPPPEPEPTSSEALAQMEIAFEGSPPQGEIQAALDRALKLYGLPVSEENYSRAGSSLVALSNDLSVPEMEILRAAIRLHTPGVALSLPDAFGLAAAELATR